MHRTVATVGVALSFRAPAADPFACVSSSRTQRAGRGALRVEVGLGEHGGFGGLHVRVVGVEHVLVVGVGHVVGLARSV